MNKKKVLIIGAGIAGLSAGSYLERNGYDTEIFETHHLSGGVCTAWKRGDYTFDYCIHWLMGTKQGTGFDVVWDELGALEDDNGNPTDIRNFDEFTRIELADGDTVYLYSDADRLEQEFLRVAPEDEKLIHHFIKDLKQLSQYQFPVNTENWRLKDKLRNILANRKVFPKFIKYAHMPLGKFASTWKSSKLQEVFRCIIPPSWSVNALIFGMAMQHMKAAGYPIGGSLPFVHNIERGYLALGGKIHYASRVKKILVKDDRAVGIQLENGKEFFGDDIVSAADGYTTIYKMLDGRYLSPQIKRAYQDFPLFPSSVYISYGVAKDLTDLPHAMVLRLPEPLVLPDDSRHQHFNLNIYHFDPTLAPKGKTSVTVLINTWNDAYWRDLAKKDLNAYKKIKLELADQVLNILDVKFPGFRMAVEEMDVSTPHTVMRYTGNWHGSYEGFAPTPLTMMTRLPKEVIGLNNCHMIGHWTEPGGGLPPAALDGRNLARKLCKRDNKCFIPKT